MLPLMKLNPFYPGQWGVKGADANLGIRLLPGAQVYYVQSTHANADNNNDGTDPDYPLATLAQAVTNATAGRGDLILLAPGHTESWAAAVALSKSGLTVLGVGSGQLRPRITMTNVAATLTISGANVTVENVLFLVGVDALPIMVDVNADDFTLRGCEFRENTAVAQQWVTAVDINGGGANAADRAKIIGCKFLSEAAGADHAIEIGAVEDGIEIRDCFITGNFAVAGVHSGSILTNLLLSGNFIRNTNAGNFAVELSAAATGMAVDNRLYADAPTTCFDPGSLMCAGNLAVNAIDQSSYPIPRAGDAPIQPHCVAKLDGAVINAGGGDPIFVVSGGPVRAKITGLVTTVIGGAANMSLTEDTTVPAATVNLNAAPVAIDADAAGTIYRNVGATSVFTPSAGLGFVLSDPVTVEETDLILTPGTVKALASAPQTGVIAWYMTYWPLSPDSRVVAAA